MTATMNGQTPLMIDLSGADPALFGEVGNTGLRAFGGYIQEEFLPALQWPQAARVYREMSDNDPIVSALLNTHDLLGRQVDHHVEPADDSRLAQEIADHCWSACTDMEDTWDDHVSSFMSMLPFGFSLHEMCFKRRLGDNVPPEIAKLLDGRDVTVPGATSKFADGRIGFRNLPIRAQDTIQRWEFTAENRHLVGAEQRTDIDPVRILPMVKMLHFRTTALKANPLGRSILRGAYRCFAADTELLTRAGWKLVSEITTDDLLATLNPDSGAIEYQQPHAVHAYEHQGDMIHASSRYVDQLVTPNHRMWVRRDHKAEHEFIDAADCKATVSFTATGDWQQPDALTVQVGSQTLPVDLWAPFLGLWIAEGHTWHAKADAPNPSRCEVGITQKEGPVADEIRKLVADLPWSCYERTDARGLVRWTFTRSELWEHLAPLGKARTKHVPEYVFGWSAREIDSFLYAYALGDGGVGGTWTYDALDGEHDYPGTELLFTASKQLADDLSHLILLCGLRPAIRHDRPTGFANSDGVYVVTVGKPFAKMRAAWETVEYDGLVYCPSTDNGIVYTRRNGKCSWSGNSWLYKRRIEEIEGIGIERDLAGLPVARVPSYVLAKNAAPEHKHLYDVMLDAVKNTRRNETDGLVLPSDQFDNGSPMFDFGLLSAQGAGGKRSIDTGAVLTRYDQRILTTALADFILLGHEGVGTLGMQFGTTKVDLFAAALDAVLNQIDGEFTDVAFPMLVKLNGWPVELTPKLKHSAVQQVDLAALAALILNMANAGFQIGGDPVLQDHLLDEANLPHTPAEELAQQGLLMELEIARRVQAELALQQQAAEQGEEEEANEEVDEEAEATS